MNQYAAQVLDIGWFVYGLISCWRFVFRLPLVLHSNRIWNLCLEGKSRRSSVIKWPRNLTNWHLSTLPLEVRFLVESDAHRWCVPWFYLTHFHKTMSTCCYSEILKKCWKDALWNFGKTADVNMSSWRKCVDIVNEGLESASFEWIKAYERMCRSIVASKTLRTLLHSCCRNGQQNLTGAA